MDGSKYRPIRRRRRLESKSKRPGAELERAARDAYLQVNSGAFWSRPGDVVLPLSLLDTKDRGFVTLSGKKEFTIRKEQLEKISKEAASLGLFPALVFRFKEDGDRLYAVVNYADLCEMLRRLKEVVRDGQGRGSGDDSLA